jgi:hypothetical protein
VVLATEARQLGTGPRHPGPEPKAALGAEHDVLQHRERLHQHEVLVDHADAGRQRIPGASHDDRTAIDQDLAPVGQGTQRVEAALAAQFGPHPVAHLPRRLDAPTYWDLMVAEDGKGQNRSFLASEENFLALKISYWLPVR